MVIARCNHFLRPGPRGLANGFVALDVTGDSLVPVASGLPNSWLRNDSSSSLGSDVSIFREATVTTEEASLMIFFAAR